MPSTFHVRQRMCLVCVSLFEDKSELADTKAPFLGQELECLSKLRFG
jgi:hypothetical protein